MKRALGLLGLIFVLNSCSPSVYRSMKDDTKMWRFHYDVGQCFGPCAEFESSINWEGELRFWGKLNTQFTGDTLISGETAFRDSLVNRIERLKFLDLKDYYGDSLVQDLPLYEFDLVWREKVSLKKVQAQLDYPKELLSFKKWLDRELAQRNLL